MIADLKGFIEREEPHWLELEKELARMRDGLGDFSDLKYARHVLSLFQRASADLSRIQGYSAEPELKAYLERLVGEGYAEIHSASRDRRSFKLWHWLVRELPQTFRRQVWGWHVSVGLTLAGALVGAVLLSFDLDGREAIYPFPHLVEMTPSERVAMEEKPAGTDRLEGAKATFSAQLMQNNISVAFRALAFGMTWGLGTVLLLFYNGAVLGAVAFDYVTDGQWVFLLGWLLPHGSFEIPAILIAGQAGVVLGRALIGWGTMGGLRTRLREIASDLASLAGLVGLLMIWAGVVEAFFSQYHAPVLPYSVKIGFGILQLAGLMWFLFFSGKERREPGERS
ncbi:stage II sporulation protein M [Phragmitibacter flavus]|uniref:Stage II sporulation protein M n=1 Tax=Phragmitibacter flavus TaxID=2576071 RepID=A0A5R8KIT8_9BACT|nr:stage II sporulation protein M [Phragmitibacter flavus]TLD71529.1 stage II sporulation protein M [Phragmitibacter flavus]